MSKPLLPPAHPRQLSGTLFDRVLFTVPLGCILIIVAFALPSISFASNETEIFKKFLVGASTCLLLFGGAQILLRFLMPVYPKPLYAIGEQTVKIGGHTYFVPNIKQVKVIQHTLGKFVLPYVQIIAPDESGKIRLFNAIDRTTPFTFLMLSNSPRHELLPLPSLIHELVRMGLPTEKIERG